MPSAEAITRSSGVVRKPRTRSALAPTYAVVTVMAAFSLRGYWRTFSERIAWTPAIRIRRLTTSATTGRRMKRSVNFMCRSLVYGPRRHLGPGRQIVPHHYRHAIAQLEGAAAHHGLAGLEPGDHRDQVAAALAEADELLVGNESGVALVVLLLLDGEDRVTIGRVEDRGPGDHQHRLLVRGEHVYIAEHARAQPPILVGEGRAHPDV